MKKKGFGTFADWSVALGALGIAITNFAGVRDALVEGAKAFREGANHAQGAIRNLLGKYLARPVAKILFVSGMLGLVLGACTFGVVPNGSPALFWALLVSAVSTGIDALWLRRFSEKQTQRAPIVLAPAAHVLSQIILASVAVAYACMAQNMLAFLFASLLMAVALIEAYVFVTIMWGMVTKVVAILALGEKAALSPVALAPIVELDNYTDFVKPIIIGISEAWRERPVKLVGSLIGGVTIFLLLLSYYPSVGWAAIVGAVVLPIAAVSAIAQAFYGLTTDVKESQKKTVWFLYKYAWVPLTFAVALRVACAFYAPLNNTASSVPRSAVKWVDDFYHGRVGIAGGFGFWQATAYLLAALVVMWIFVAITKGDKRDWFKTSARIVPGVFAAYYVLAMTNSCAGGKHKERGLNPFSEDATTAASATSSASASSSTSSAPPPPTGSATTSAAPPSPTASATASASATPAVTNKPVARVTPTVPRPGQPRIKADDEINRDFNQVANELGVE